MINAATVGVMDHMENMTRSEVILRNLMSKAAPTAMHSTRTAKIAPLLVSVSFVNILQTSSISFVGDIPAETVTCGQDLSLLTSFRRLHRASGRPSSVLAVRRILRPQIGDDPCSCRTLA